MPVTHLDALPAGTRLGEFEITGLLGVGGFGMVYQAFDHSLQRDVAIKEYMPASLARRSHGTDVAVRSSVDLPTFTNGLKSFMAEARLLAQFDHPSLVKVFRFWEENNTAYMVMPLYRGITLKQARAHMRCPPPEEWLRKVLWSILGALKVLHNGNTMHRDISPENIFLQDVGPPVLLDLGAARRAIHEKNQQLTATLKFSYAPIEQYGDAPGIRQGPWTDLYALASVMYGCLANELPLPATLRVVRDRQPSFATIARRVQDEFGLNYSTEFVLTIDQALAVRPAGRPKSANTFARLMDLHVPPGMSKFDWRAELGDIYVSPGSAEAAGAAQSAVTDPQSTTVALVPQAVATPAPQATEPAAKPVFSGGAAPAKSRSWVWLAVGAALLAALGIAVWVQLAPPQSQSEATAGPDARTPPLAASEPSAAPVDTAASAPPAASEPAADASAPASAASAGLSVPAPAVRPGATARKVERTRPGLDRKSTGASEQPVARPASADVPVRAESAEEAARKSAASAPTKPASAPARTPASICADAGFIGRPMCIHDECQKPEFARLPMCVENEKRLREPRFQAN